LAASAGTVVPVRLVKGAYWDGEVKRAQELGLPSFPVWTRKSHTDLAYLACAFALLDARPHLWPQFATHNANTIATLLAAAGPADGSFELQRLHGMGEALHREVAATTAVGTRVYAPVGSHRDLLAYLVRRLLENGANSSFVNRLADPDEPAAALVEPPCVLLARAAAPPDASEPQVTEPAALVAGMTGRRHAAGLDAQQPAHLATLRAGLAAWRTATWHATPLLATPTQGDDLGAARVIENPARRDDRVGTCVDASEAVGARAAQAAHAAFRRWEATPARTRAAILRSAADAFEAHRDELHALVMREAGRTLVDAIAELREAVDFLRFYADEAERLFASPQPLPGPTGESNALWLRGRGPWLAVSPWNFPLAIFTGQVAAALAAGNTVLAKPAEQTPLVAWRATQLLHAAGVPRDALQLLPGPGDTLGAALVRDTRVAGVVFTGSTEVARRIQRALAERPGAIVPLIAETGGINAMVVDSTALPQQVTDAVIASAFRSAGQRCSALRLLCVQADIADVCLAMLDGALRELRVGDPWDLATDVGPLIDADAVDRVRAHVAQLERDGRVRARAPLADRVAAHGHYVAPVVAEIPAVDALRDEVFGPCLHVVRWPADGLEALLDAIDATGYGLTFGLHSRIDARADAVAAQVRAGNVYVNRNIIGANVGMQPFGGEGLSGTGPKAGGPHYLVRFAVERTITVNTAAAGGNVALLAGTATRGT
jgi:RHH-type proline utilization regulon transcriptional repressor/proline dehydrogenase/delta 1-pyrroline-5-carboxylate dehydrogenase